MGIIIGPETAPATSDDFVTLGGIYSLMGGKKRRPGSKDPWVDLPWLKIGPYTGPDWSDYFNRFFYPEGQSDIDRAERDKGATILKPVTQEPSAVRASPSGAVVVPTVPSEAATIVSPQGIAALPTSTDVVSPEGLTQEPDPRINEMTIVTPRKTDVAKVVPSGARQLPSSGGIESLTALPSDAVAVPATSTSSPLTALPSDAQPVQSAAAEEQPDPRINEMTFATSPPVANAPIVPPDAVSPIPPKARQLPATPDSLAPTTDLTLPDISFVRPEGPPGGFPAAPQADTTTAAPDQQSYDPLWEKTKDWAYRHLTTKGRVEAAAEEARADPSRQPLIPGSGQFTAATAPDTSKQPLIPGTGEYTADTALPIPGIGQFTTATKTPPQPPLRSPEGTPQDLQDLWTKITTWFGGDSTAPKPDSTAPGTEPAKPGETKPGSTEPAPAPDAAAPGGVTPPPAPPVVSGGDGASLAASLGTDIETLKTLFPKLDFTNPQQDRLDAYLAHENERTAALAQLAMASGMIASAGKSWEAGAQGVMGAANVYDQGYKRYANALSDAAERYQKQKDTELQYNVGLTEAGLKLYTTAQTEARSDAREARKQQVETINKYFGDWLDTTKPGAGEIEVDPDKRKQTVEDIQKLWKLSIDTGRIINRFGGNVADQPQAATK